MRTHCPPAVGHFPGPGLSFAFTLIGLLIAESACAWPDLRIVKTGPAQAAPGDVITYTLNYTNAGPVKGVNVVMKDFLPSNTTPVTGTLNGGSVSGNTISWNLGTLNSKAKGSRSFQVRISADAPAPGAITNRSQIFGSEAEEKGKTNDNYSTFITTLISANHAPVARDDAYSVAENSTLLISAPGILANDSDADGDTLTALLVNGPAHGVLSLNESGGFTYQPNADYSGEDSFTYRANDGAADSGNAQVHLTVLPVNRPPVAQGDQYSTLEDTTLTVVAPGVLTNDMDPDGDVLMAKVVTLPGNGQLSLGSDGGFTYTPNSNYSGLDSFTYQADDGQAESSPATVTINVTPVYRPPETNNWSGKSFTTYEDTTLTVTPPGVLRGIVDAHGGLLKAALVRAITNGTLSLDLDGAFRLTPLTNFNGSDGFQFAVSDDHSNRVVLNVAVTVIPVNDPPSFRKGANFRIGQNAGPQMVPGWATDISAGPPDESGQAVIFQVVNDNDALFSVPPAVTADGTLTYCPAQNASGTATVTVIAHDDGGTANGGVDSSAPEVFSISVNAPPTVQITSPTNGASFFAPASFTVLADAQDVDGTVEKVEFFTGTNRIAEADSGTPFFTVLTNLAVGSYTFGAMATDDFGATGAAVPVTVNVIDRPPLTFLTSVYYNPQKDVFEQRVRVSNPTYSTLNAVRVLVFNLTNAPAITVGNGSGFLNGIPYVQTYAVIPPGNYVDLTVEYLSPLRIMPNPVLQAALVPPAAAIALVQGDFQPINRGLLLANRTFLVEFKSLSNRVYTVEYSGDLLHWQAAQPAVAGDGNWIQWIDNGEPKTVGPPAAAPARFYRLRLLP